MLQGDTLGDYCVQRYGAELRKFGGKINYYGREILSSISFTVHLLHLANNIGMHESIDVTLMQH